MNFHGLRQLFDVLSIFKKKLECWRGGGRVRCTCLVRGVVEWFVRDQINYYFILFLVRVRSNTSCFELVFEENQFYFALHILFREFVLGRAKEHLKRVKEHLKRIKGS